MLQSIKDIDPEKISPNKDVQNVIVLLLNVIENLQQEITELKLAKQKLQDENSILKGGNGRPVLKGSKKNLRLGDISSKGKEKGSSDKSQNNKDDKTANKDGKD